MALSHLTFSDLDSQGQDKILTMLPLIIGGGGITV